MYLRYAQECGGQKLHLVEVNSDGSVSGKALCGRLYSKRGTWGMTINCPLGNACKKCLKVANRLKEPTPTIEISLYVKAGV